MVPLRSKSSMRNQSIFLLTMAVLAAVMLLTRTWQPFAVNVGNQQATILGHLISDNGTTQDPAALLDEKCAQRTWRYRLSTEKNLTDSPFKSMLVENEITKNCSLAVIAAGFPRSGSTLQTQLVYTLSEVLNVPLYSTYWNRQLRKGSRTSVAGIQKGIAEYSHILQKLKAHNQSILVLKSHDWDDRLLNMCQRQIVLTSHRNLLSIARSFYKLGWADSFEELVEHLDRHIANHQCWKRYAVVDIQYEVFQSHVDMYALHILSLVAAAFDRPENAESLLSNPKVAGYLRKYLNEDANRWTPRTSNGGHTDVYDSAGLPDGWASHVKSRYKDWWEQYAYDVDKKDAI